MIFLLFLLIAIVVTLTLTLVFLLKPKGFFAEPKRRHLLSAEHDKFMAWGILCAVLFFLACFAFGMVLTVIQLGPQQFVGR